MLVECPKLNPLARAALVDIQSSGVEITPDIVLWVHSAAEKIKKVPPRPIAELVDWPVMAGGVALYPLTFGAVDWLMRLPLRLRGDIRVVGYACAHAKDRSAFERLSILGVAGAVAKWTMTLTCSQSALSAAIDMLLDCAEYTDIKENVRRKRDPDSFEWGAVVRALCTKYPGTTGSYWTWEVSREYCHSMIQLLNEELPDDVKVSDYEVEANAAFRNIVEHIKAGGTNGG